MLLTQGVPYIDREELGLSYISCPLLLRFRGPRHDDINLNISLYIVDHYLNIGRQNCDSCTGFKDPQILRI